MFGGIIIKISEEKIILIIVALTQLIMQVIANMTVVALPNISMDLSFSADSIFMGKFDISDEFCCF